jgi:hypothetical protein
MILYSHILLGLPVFAISNIFPVDYSTTLFRYRGYTVWDGRMIDER